MQAVAPEPLWHVKTRTDARGLHFFEVGTRDGSHYVTVSGNQRWMSRDENAAKRLAAKANLILVEAVLEAGRVEPEPEWRVEAGREAQAAAEAAGFATVEEWHNAPGWHDASEHGPGPDPEPQPGDGPDYHADHAAWAARQEKSA